MYQSVHFHIDSKIISNKFKKRNLWLLLHIFSHTIAKMIAEKYNNKHIIYFLTT